ncbi:MAG TPA: hypothetical protein PKJ16_17265 [Spirochaetota bacterium]|nr:hypothetical protein [Spirochaetota bacterium]
MISKRRWYDRDPDLRKVMITLEHADEETRNRIVHEINRLLCEYGCDGIDCKLTDLPLAMNKRWYDCDPYWWITVNCLRYVNADIIKKIAL